MERGAALKSIGYLATISAIFRTFLACTGLTDLMHESF